MSSLSLLIIIVTIARSFGHFSTPKLEVISYGVVEGDIMTLSCGRRIGPHKDTTFYKDGRKIQGPSSSRLYEIQVAHLVDSGNYKCEVSQQRLRPKSQEVNVQIQELFSTPKIKVDPYPVVEGDIMTLTCDTRLNRYRNNTHLQFAFYRNGQVIQGPSSSEKYQLNVDLLGDSGSYTCEVSTRNGVRKFSQEEYVQIQDLFTLPEITANQNSVVEGECMALTCDTSLSPQRSATKLMFAFYNDGNMVQEFDSMNKYEIQSAQSNNSGSYSCEVSAANIVKKDSRKKFIEVQELFPYPEIKVTPYPVTEGDRMSLKCDTVRPKNSTGLQFTFYRDGRNIQEFSPSDMYDVPSAQLEDSGKYTCRVKTLDGSVLKRSQMISVIVNEQQSGLAFNKPKTRHGSY